MSISKPIPMKIMHLILLSLIPLFPAFAAAEPALTCRVMTFNLRYASPKQPNSWPERRPVVAATIRKTDPDFFGTQEGLYAQLKDIADDLPEYRWIGEGRRGGSKDEFMAVFYKTERLEPTAFGHFWLSDTPETIGSTSWGNMLPRMVTWVRFKDLKSGLEFYNFNTHFDHQSQPAREQSGQLLSRRIPEIATTFPVIVTGDFNLDQNSAVHQSLLQTTGFTDAWQGAERHVGPQVSTFHNFSGNSPGTSQIDWILLSPQFHPKWAEVVTHNENGQYPSDHFPVLCEVSFERPAPAQAVAP